MTAEKRIYITPSNNSPLKRFARFETLLILTFNVKVPDQNAEELTRVDLSTRMERSKMSTNLLDLDSTKTIVMKIHNSQNSVSQEKRSGKDTFPEPDDVL